MASATPESWSEILLSTRSWSEKRREERCDEEMDWHRARCGRDECRESRARAGGLQEHPGEESADSSGDVCHGGQVREGLEEGRNSRANRQHIFGPAAARRKLGGLESPVLFPFGQRQRRDQYLPRHADLLGAARPGGASTGLEARLLPRWREAVCARETEWRGAARPGY